MCLNKIVIGLLGHLVISHLAFYLSLSPLVFRHSSFFFHPLPIAYCLFLLQPHHPGNNRFHNLSRTGGD